MKKDNHIFAIEGEWEAKLNKDLTIKSTLTLLQEVRDVNFIFRKTNTVKSLLSYLETSSTASYKKYGTIVIATHGNGKDIELSEGEYITLKKLGKRCEGMFEGKAVHFSSCEIMKDEKGMIEFKKITNAKCVCGYTKNVDFLESSVFDILLLYRLYKNSSGVITQAFLERNYPDLVDRLGFKLI